MLYSYCSKYYGLYCSNIFFYSVTVVTTVVTVVTTVYYSFSTVIL